MLIVIIWSVVGFVACLACLVDASLPGGPHLPAAMAVIVFTGVFPAFGSAIIAARLRPSGKGAVYDDRQLFRAIPTRAKAATGAVLAITIIYLMVASNGMPDGQPLSDSTGYVLDYRGVRTPISQEQFEQAEAANRRIMVGMPMLFYVAAGVVAFGARARRRGATPSRSVNG